MGEGPLPVGPVVDVPLEIGKGAELLLRGWVLEAPVPELMGVTVVPVGPTVEVTLEIGKGPALPEDVGADGAPVPELTGVPAVPVGPAVDVPLEIGKGALLPEDVGADVAPVPGPVAVAAGPVPVGPTEDVRFDVGYGAELSETGGKVPGPVGLPDVVAVAAVPVGPTDEVVLESGKGGADPVLEKPVGKIDPGPVAPVGSTDHVLLGKGYGAVLPERDPVGEIPVPLTDVGDNPVPVECKVDVVFGDGNGTLDHGWIVEITLMVPGADTPVGPELEVEFGKGNGTELPVVKGTTENPDEGDVVIETVPTPVPVSIVLEADVEFVVGKGAVLLETGPVESGPGAVPGADDTAPVPPVPVIEVELETGYGGALGGPFDVLGLPEPVPRGVLPVPVGPWAEVEFDNGKGAEVAEGTVVEKAVPLLEEMGITPDPVGKAVELELETG